MDKENQLDPIEEALLELVHAEDAGVFTDAVRRGQSRDSIGVGHETLLSRRAWRGFARLAAAAVVALAVGFGGWIISTKLSQTRAGSELARGLATTSAYPPADAFQRCFAGPTMSRPENCRKHDYDGDGDVDIADFRAFQLAYATPSG